MKYHKQLQYFENYTIYNNIGDKNIGCTLTTSDHGCSGNKHIKKMIISKKVWFYFFLRDNIVIRISQKVKVII